MTRLAVSVAVSVVALLRAIAPAFAVASDTSPASTALLECLEPIARTFKVRIVDKTARVAPVACTPLRATMTLQQALDRQLLPNGLAWRRLEDGTVEVVAAHAPQSLQLPALDIEGDPLPEIKRPDNPLATPLVERATAATSLDQRWLDTAPLLGFNQLSWYAPNVYGTGQSLAIRGTERDNDYFPALTVTFDGIDLGTRLLDDELVPLEDVTNLTLGRGPRTFEAGEGSQAGAIALKTAPPAAEPITSIALGVGSEGARNGAVDWSGPLGSTGLGATIALDEHVLPSFVRQVTVPEANVDKRRNEFGRIKLHYAPDAVAGLSAGLSALALSGDSSDRRIVPPAPSFGLPAPFDPFDRNSYASDPVVAQTHARGAASFVRYEEPDRWAVDAHASITTITRDSSGFPHDVQWADHELRRRTGLTASDHPAPDWTLIAAIEHDRTQTSFNTPISSGQLIFNYFATTTNSASLWAEHDWSPAWTTGLGLRWIDERTTVFLTPDRAYSYHLPIPLAVVEWHPWKDQTVSLSYGTGYRNGGQVGSGIFTYSPERGENVEATWRAQWFGGAVHTALSAFNERIRDRFTYFVYGPTGSPILGRVQQRGLEFEVDADLSDAWKVRAGFGALSSRYSSFSDHPTSEAPPQTALLGVRYGRGQGTYAALDAYRAAGAVYYISSNPAGRLPLYDTLSARVGYRTTQWDAALIATNVSNAKYIERIELSAANQFGFRLGDPRRIELRLKWNW